MPRTKSIHSKLLSYCDAFAEYPHLTIDKEQEYQSNFGGFLTLLAVLLIITQSYSSVSDFLTRNKPVITKEEATELYPSQINLTNSDFFFVLAVNDSNYDWQKSSVIFDVVLHDIQHTDTPNSQGAYIEDNPVQIDLALCNASDFRQSPTIENLFRDLNFRYALCPVIKDYQLSGSRLTNIISTPVNWKYLEITADPCFFHKEGEESKRNFRPLEETSSRYAVKCDPDSEGINNDVVVWFSTVGLGGYETN